MEQQRPLRLGDLVDDYCPRERRVTNHAIVAIVEDVIRQTRCTACESDHVYKGGKAPVRKKKAPKAALYDQVLANVTGDSPAAAVPRPETPVPVAATAAAVLDPVPAPEPSVASDPAPEPPAAAAPVAPSPEPSEPAAPVADEVWTLNRPLIRASLPRNDNQPPPPRAIPEFTMHQRNARGSQNFRGGGANGNTNGNSSGFRGGFRSDGQGQGEKQPGARSQRPGGRRRRRPKTPRPQE